MSRLTNHARFLVDGDRILPLLLADLAKAERTIHLSVYLFWHDVIGDAIAGVLEERALAGVTVRVLVHLVQRSTGRSSRAPAHAAPGGGDPLDLRRLSARMKRAGVALVDTNIDYVRVPNVADARLRSISTQIRDAIDAEELHVDHRKIVVVDGRVAWTGGVDFGARSLFHVPFDADPGASRPIASDCAAPREPWTKWHDGFARFEGPIASAVEDAFRTRWILDGGAEYVSEPAPQRAPGPEAGAVVKDVRVYLNEPDGRPNPIRELYIERIRTAVRSIFIENPQFYHPAIVDALCEAKENRPDLDIVLIMPGREHNEHAFAQDAQEHGYARYVACGIEVREYEGRFSHLKVAVFDERWSIHGSANLSYRSLEDDKDFELVVLVDDEAFARSILEQVRDVDRQRSRRITHQDVEAFALDTLRLRMSDPRTLLLLSQRIL